ncbi:DUF4325 domain-containing protein [Rhodanobacter glycinis]|uniref:STAS-like domain-containing protein n=1 Tax=Rhodanobacter glycinis TaxID=582702 RepID=UPI001129B2C0|nr:STAS-like domain-containing protein [Rhodanobacter glycinis]TPG50717.1 DUF4325 domain-containing protein [Rhodanobacter glycinis]
MSGEKVVDVARDFSRFPAGRFKEDGPFSGQAFRDEVLLPRLRQNQEALTIELDGALGYGSSFLEEAFGGLVRLCGFKAADLLQRLNLRSVDDSLVREIRSYITRAV